MPPKKKKRASGPLKRTGKAAESWDRAVGESINVIPANKLPTLKTVLQRYRGLRIEEHSVSVYNLAARITDEVLVVWGRARVPTKKRDNCVAMVKACIEEWNKMSKRPLNRDSASYQDTLDKLFDLTPRPPGNSFLTASFDLYCLLY